MSERNATEIAMLVEMTDNALGDAMLIYPGHDSKDWLRVEAPHLVFVLEAGSVKGGPRQLSHTEFSLISRVSTAADNDEIYGIPKPGDVVFLELDLSRTVVETEIWVRTSLQHQAFPASSDGGGEKSAEAISCSTRPQINLRSGANVQSAWDAPYNQAQPLASSVMRLSYANIVVQQE
jgi:hypothetical protein